MVMKLGGLGFLLPRDASALRIFLAFVYGSLLGWSPTPATLHGVVLLLSLVVIRVPWMALLLIAALSWLSGMLFLDPLIDRLGQGLLAEESLQALWVSIYNAPILPMARLHNSMILGALVLALGLSPIWYVVSWKLSAKLQQKGA